MRTQVGIVGAGPAGLTLARLLEREGIDTVVVEARSRSYIEQRVRAGVLEQGTVDLLDDAGVGQRMRAEGLVHHGIVLQVDGERHRLAMSDLTGGRTIVVYGQQELVKDLVAARLASGLRLRFDTECTDLVDLDTDRPRALLREADGTSSELECDLVIGADGFHGVSRQLVAAGSQVFERDYPFAWLGVLAQVAPSCDELIYARHANGFALHSLRSPTISRLYLQCTPDEDLDAWSDGQIWDELQTRLGVSGWTLAEGPILEKGVTPMRSVVAEPMRHGRLLLAGDAGHIVPPTGAKGLNLAIADVAILAPRIIDFLRRSESSGLDDYSDVALRRVWRAQDFSNEMTLMLHSNPDRFEDKRQQARLRYVVSSEAAQRSIAENYVGLQLA
ncbi:MAG TPA: 4-hydroxybenzoate 3-monooxygenase [Mycobacteriales bacterium]|jgi:p-hydroxybenzoate 3-monooxygenase|nr:4-hydroxybenzoate 3-monooxygenase [Mycobacteriales bacterium]